MRKVLFLLFSLLTFFSCDPVTERLIFVNNTEEPVYYLLYTDTIPYLDAQLCLLYPYDTVKPNFGIAGIRNYKGWEYKINHECTDSALHIFIFCLHQITDEMMEDKNNKYVVYVIGEPPQKGEYVWITEECIKNREYERLSFTVKELDSLNWTVVYRGQNKIKEDADECSP